MCSYVSLGSVCVCVFTFIIIYSHLEKDLLTEILCKVWKINHGILLENSRKNNVNEVNK